jgi:hypothetical protein
MISDVSRFHALCDFEQSGSSLAHAGTLVVVSTSDEFLVLLRA